MGTNSFEASLYAFTPEIRGILSKLSDTVKSNVEEIRLRTGLPLALTVAGDIVFVSRDSKIKFTCEPDLPMITSREINECFRLLCKGSVYAHGEELKNGFVIMDNGCRAGVCGTLNEELIMKDVTSINIRIARQIFGAANSIVRANITGGLLIAGPPGCGKTTLLRDLIRQVSNGECGKMKRIAVIDSRSEISGGANGNFGNDLGINTDVLFTHDKAAGVEIALRTMFPDIIAFDEIGSEKELESVMQSFHSGVEIFTTAHIGTTDELMKRSVTRQLIRSGAISNVALLPRLHSAKINLISAKELCCGIAV